MAQLPLLSGLWHGRNPTLLSLVITFIMSSLYLRAPMCTSDTTDSDHDSMHPRAPVMVLMLVLRCQEQEQGDVRVRGGTPESQPVSGPDGLRVPGRQGEGKTEVFRSLSKAGMC